MYIMIIERIFGNERPLETIIEHIIFNFEILKCTANYDDNIRFKNGTMSFCAVHGRPHYFILVEDAKNTIAFSYVPQSTKTFIDKTYSGVESKYKQTPNDFSSLIGYIPIAFSKSHIVDTWKLTDRFVRLDSKPFKRWRFHPYSELKTYNVFSVVPYLGVTDCIGYSMRHYNDLTTDIKLIR
jgi:hypothetical protein